MIRINIKQKCPKVYTSFSLQQLVILDLFSTLHIKTRFVGFET
jgi:hypothetical protein